MRELLHIADQCQQATAKFPDTGTVAACAEARAMLTAAADCCRTTAARLIERPVVAEERFLQVRHRALDLLIELADNSGPATSSGAPGVLISEVYKYHVVALSGSPRPAGWRLSDQKTFHRIG